MYPYWLFEDDEDDERGFLPFDEVEIEEYRNRSRFPWVWIAVLALVSFWVGVFYWIYA